MKYRILIADDEDHIRKQLEYIFDQLDGMEVSASCSNGADALEQIMIMRPDIVLLDIRMSGIDGIKLGGMMEQIREKPYLIYVTAYEEYAVKALNLGARGYILKPFSDQDVHACIQRAVQTLDAEQGKQATPISAKVATHDEDKILFFNQSDIVLAVAKNRKVYLHIDGMEYLSRFTLTELEKKLDSGSFFRSHRNFIVCIMGLKPSPSGEAFRFTHLERSNVGAKG